MYVFTFTDYVWTVCILLVGRIHFPQMAFSQQPPLIEVNGAPGRVFKDLFKDICKSVIFTVFSSMEGKGG
jgi:hypothetical protein